MLEWLMANCLSTSVYDRIVNVYGSSIFNLQAPPKCVLVTCEITLKYASL